MIRRCCHLVFKKALVISILDVYNTFSAENTSPPCIPWRGEAPQIARDEAHLDRIEEHLGTGVVVGRTRTAHAPDAADRHDLAPEVP